MGGEPRDLPTPAEQYAAYRLAKAEYDRQYAYWSVNGKQGPPPPMPIRPHTPGFNHARPTGGTS